MRLFTTAALLALTTMFSMGGCRRAAVVEAQASEGFRNSIGMEMIKLSSGYYVSKYETRQSEFEAVMGYNPSLGPHRDGPVENLTIEEATAFCTALTELEQQRGTLPQQCVYDLPSFAEWKEFVADAQLAGSITGTGRPDLQSLEFAMPVGSGEVNRLGIFDLRGNVIEFGRGRHPNGSFMSFGAHFGEIRKDFLASCNRGYVTPTMKGKTIGFRCVLRFRGTK